MLYNVINSRKDDQANRPQLCFDILIALKIKMILPAKKRVEKMHSLCNFSTKITFNFLITCKVLREGKVYSNSKQTFIFTSNI
jgi:hypothetical protein